MQTVALIVCSEVEAVVVEVKTVAGGKLEWENICLQVEMQYGWAFHAAVDAKAGTEPVEGVVTDTEFGEAVGIEFVEWERFDIEDAGQERG